MKRNGWKNSGQQLTVLSKHIFPAEHGQKHHLSLQRPSDVPTVFSFTIPAQILPVGVDQKANKILLLCWTEPFKCTAWCKIRCIWQRGYILVWLLTFLVFKSSYIIWTGSLSLHRAGLFHPDMTTSNSQKWVAIILEQKKPQKHSHAFLFIFWRNIFSLKIQTWIDKHPSIPVLCVLGKGQWNSVKLQLGFCHPNWFPDCNFAKSGPAVIHVWQNSVCSVELHKYCGFPHLQTCMSYVIWPNGTKKLHYYCLVATFVIIRAGYRL